MRNQTPSLVALLGGKKQFTPRRKRERANVVDIAVSYLLSFLNRPPRKSETALRKEIFPLARALSNNPPKPVSLDYALPRSVVDGRIEGGTRFVLSVRGDEIPGARRNLLLFALALFTEREEDEDRYLIHLRHCAAPKRQADGSLDVCGKWYRAERSDSVTCSAACRQRKKRDDDIGRKRPATGVARRRRPFRSA